MNKLSALLWKELVEVWRDKKALLTTVLLPLVAMPLVGLLMATFVMHQPVNIAIISEDSPYCSSGGICYDPAWMLGNITQALASRGFNVIEAGNLKEVLEDPAVDLIIYVPPGFSRNATLLNAQGEVKIIRRANIQMALQAEGIARSVISYQSSALSQQKISYLAELAGLGAGEYTYQALVYPITAGETTIVGPSGAQVGVEEELKGMLARMLVLSFSFIVSPASTFIIDGIIGERERKTMEILLSSPIKLKHIIYSKLFGATVMGMVASVADVTGLILYFAAVMFALGGVAFLIFHPSLIALHAITSFLTILVTVSISAPFITRTRGIKAAGNIASIITGIGLVFFLSGWLVDFPRLPQHVLIPLMVIPYTHSILAIQYFVLGNMGGVYMSLLILLLESIALLALVIKAINREALLVGE